MGRGARRVVELITRPPALVPNASSFAENLVHGSLECRIVRRCRQRTRRYGNNRIEADHRNVQRRLRAMQGPRTTTTAWAVIQGIEAASMIRKGQRLGITRRNLHGQAWLFGVGS